MRIRCFSERDLYGHRYFRSSSSREKDEHGVQRTDQCERQPQPQPPPPPLLTSEGPLRIAENAAATETIAGIAEGTLDEGTGPLGDRAQDLASSITSREETDDFWLAGRKPKIKLHTRNRFVLRSFGFARKTLARENSSRLLHYARAQTKILFSVDLAFQLCSAVQWKGT